MELNTLIRLQSQRGSTNNKGSGYDVKSYERVKEECRKVIEEESNSYRDLVDPLLKKARIKELIRKYIMDNKPVTEGFVDSENNVDTIGLTNKLIQDIIDYGILAWAMDNPDVFEIQCNGKEIKVELKGKVGDLIDPNTGKIVTFSSVEEQEIIIKKMLGDVKLTPKDALVSSSTLEGYRIQAVHSSAMGVDPNDPTGDRFHSFVLRKFKKEKMSLGDIVKKGTLSDNMARTLALCTSGGLTFFTVGPTASGKTTTNNAILHTMPISTRVILIQNPSEIDLRIKDASGRIVNNVLHLEARDIEAPTKKDPTAVNLMDSSLRLSPTFVSFGELRRTEEFKLAMTIADAGHPFNCTYHSESSEGAISRFLTAYLSASGNEPSHLALANLAGHVDLIIVQKIMRDGKRRIIQISEVLGVKEDNPNKADINDLYIFDINGKPEYDAFGNVTKINGNHKRVGKISDHMIRKLKQEGVDEARFDFLVADVKETEVEEYSGVNIEKYGMNINH